MFYKLLITLFLSCIKVLSLFIFELVILSVPVVVVFLDKIMKTRTIENYLSRAFNLENAFIELEKDVVYQQFKFHA
jgi:hypothetical protein